MVITHHGANYFKLASGNTTVLIDPTNQRSFRGANIIINTERLGRYELPPKGEDVFWIDHAGEYEVRGIGIRGIQFSSNDAEKTIYCLDFENIRFLVLGFLESSPKDELQEYLTDIDVVLVPLEEGHRGEAGMKRSSAGLVKPGELAKFIRQLGPALIVTSASKNLKSFLKEFSKEKCKEEEKIVLRKSDLKEEEMDIRCLKS